MRLVYEDFNKKDSHVKEISSYLKSKLSELDVYINSNDMCLPHIVNVSLNGIKSETMLHALEGYDIYVSTQTACSTGNYTKAVYAVVRDEDRAGRSLRISLSYLTTKEELDKFISVLKKLINELHIK